MNNKYAKDIAKGLDTTFKVLFNADLPALLRRRGFNYASVAEADYDEKNMEMFLLRVAELWQEEALEANNFEPRLLAWARRTPEMCWIAINPNDLDRKGINVVKELLFVEPMSIGRSTPKYIRNNKGEKYARTHMCITTIEGDVVALNTNLIPMFPGYYEDVEAIDALGSIHTSVKYPVGGVESVEDIDGNELGSNTAKSWVISTNTLKSCTINLKNNEGNTTMSKVSKTVANVANTGKNSLKLSMGIAAGNATNSIVKAALRPVLEPALRKALQPKGLIQRTMGKSKVEDSVSAILDSPLMDLVAASILVTLTSTDMVKSDKLIRGAELASDAAMLRLFELVDFDALVGGITSKVTTIVSTLEGEAVESK